MSKKYIIILMLFLLGLSACIQKGKDNKPVPPEFIEPDRNVNTAVVTTPVVTNPPAPVETVIVPEDPVVIVPPEPVEPVTPVEQPPRNNESGPVNPPPVVTPVEEPTEPPLTNPRPPVEPTPVAPEPLPPVNPAPVVTPVEPALIATAPVTSPVDTTFKRFLGKAPRFDFYVNKGAVGASDNNDGKAAVKSGTSGPWLTIGKAFKTAQGGDIVHIYTGVYSENINATISGAVGKPIRFYGETGSIPTLKGSIRLRNSKFVEIVGLRVIGPKSYPSNWKDNPNVIIDDPSVGALNPSEDWATRGPKVKKKYKTFETTYHDVFEGVNFSAFTGGIWITKGDSIVIASNTVTLHTIGIDIDGGSNNITIYNNVAHHCRSGIWSYDGGFGNSLVDRNHVYQSLGTGITIGGMSSKVTVSNNLSEYNSIHNYTVTDLSSDCLVKNNVGKFAGFYSETMPLPGSSCFNFYNVGPGNVADGNYAAYQIDVTHNDGNGFISDESGHGTKFVNNVCYRNFGSGIALTRTANNRVFNNTFIENGWKRTRGTNGAGVNYSAVGNIIKNNIFYKNTTAGIHGDGTINSQTINYNLYFGTSPAIHDSYTANQRVYKTVADVIAKTGQEKNGLNADPLFDKTSFRITKNSPARGKCDVTVIPVWDFFGVKRDTAPDIGAVEFK